MSTKVRSTFNKTLHRPVKVAILNGLMSIELANGQTLTTPLNKHPWLLNASSDQRNHYELGYASIWWSDLDEGIDIEWLLMQPQRSQMRSAAKMGSFHVVPHASGWQVKGEGNTRASTVHETKKEAIQKGREIARAQHSELVIHGKDGKIQERSTPKSSHNKGREIAHAQHSELVIHGKDSKIQERSIPKSSHNK